MGMSHAAAVWIPASGIDRTKLEDIVGGACEHPGLELELFVRTTPVVTLMVAPLDQRDDLQMDFELLNRSASALARKLGVPTYALYAFFGSGDWMMVTAFGPNGEETWSEGSDENADPEAMRPVADGLGLGLVGEDDDGRIHGVTFPYWKMLSEAAPSCREDVLGLCIKPTFDVGYMDGWTPVGTFVAGAAPPELPSTATTRRAGAEVTSRADETPGAVLEAAFARRWAGSAPASSPKKKKPGTKKKPGMKKKARAKQRR